MVPDLSKFNITAVGYVMCCGHSDEDGAQLWNGQCFLNVIH